MTALGIFLLVVAIALFIAEAHLPSFGLLAAAGVVLTVLAVIAIFDGNEVTVPVVVVTGLLVATLLGLGVNRGLRASRQPVRAGYEHLLGRSAEVRETLDPVGQVFVDGAIWRARAAEGAGPQRPGDRVRVQAVEGLTLRVAPAVTDPNDQGDS